MGQTNSSSSSSRRGQHLKESPQSQSNQQSSAKRTSAVHHQIIEERGPQQFIASSSAPASLPIGKEEEEEEKSLQEEKSLLLAISRKVRRKKPKTPVKLVKKGQKESKAEKVQHQQPPTTEAQFCAGMNPRFPVESGESLSTAAAGATKIHHQQQQQPIQVHQSRSMAMPEDITNSQQLPVWVYVIFRKNPSSGHDKVNIKDSLDGPVFWTRRVIYVFCCSCHFDKHERDLLKLLAQWKSRVERVCLVDRPLDYPFLPDSFFGFLANHLPRLEFVYLRELDLEKINRATVERLSQHRHLKKLIVHQCRNYEVLQDFQNLPQLLVVKGEIQGLKAMIGVEDMDESSSSMEAPKNGTSKEGSADYYRNGGGL